MPLKCFYLGRNDQDHTCLFAVGTKRYEYHLSPQQLDTVEFLCKRVSVLKAFRQAARPEPDIGNLHIVDYWLYLATRPLSDFKRIPHYRCPRIGRYLDGEEEREGTYR